MPERRIERYRFKTSVKVVSVEYITFHWCNEVYTSHVLHKLDGKKE